MVINSLILSLGVLLTALPVGWLLAWLCKDELVVGRKWFVVIMAVSGLLFLGSLVFYHTASVLLSLGYMAVVTYVSLYKSRDEKFVKI